MHRFRNRSFLKELDFTTREMEHLLELSRSAQVGQVRGQRGSSPGGPGDRPRVREDLHAHALGIRGGLLRPGRARDLSRSHGLAAGPQGVDRRHGTRAGADVRRHPVPRRRTRRRRGARAIRGGAGVQRPDRRVAPDADARRLSDHGRGEPQAVSRDLLLLHGRRAQQHGPVAARHGRDHGQRRPPVRSEEPLAARRRAERRAPARGAYRREDHDHGQPRRGAAGRRLRPHRCLGLDGRARGDLGSACRAVASLPGELGGAGEDRQPARALHALPAVVPRQEHDRRPQGDGARPVSRTGSRSPTTCSSPMRASCSTRPKTASTPSRRCWWRRSGSPSRLG